MCRYILIDRLLQLRSSTMKQNSPVQLTLMGWENKHYKHCTTNQVQVFRISVIFGQKQQTVVSRRKKSMSLTPPIHFVRFIPQIKFRLDLLPQTISAGPIYPNKICLLFLHVKAEFKFKLCEWIENMMSYVRKIQ